MASTASPPTVNAGFLCFCDCAGHRHAVRVGCITAFRDADETGTETLIVLNGRDAVLTPYDLEELLASLCCSQRQR